MRHLLYIVPVLLLCACSGGNSSKFKNKLSNKFMDGVWIVSSSDLVAGKPNADDLSMHLLRFKNDGTVFYDAANAHPQNGSFEAKDMVLKISLPSSGNIYFSLSKGTDSSLALVVEKHPDYKEGGQILLKRINDKVYKLIDPAWKKLPTTMLSDDDIKNRLHDMLAYYEQFFWMLDSRSVGLFSLNKIPLPFYYTADGLGMKKFIHRHKEWDVYFGDSTQSLKAYTLLQRSFYNVGMSGEINHFRRYAPMFATIAKNVKK